MMDALGANKAGIRLILDDDTDLADKIDPRFVSLTLVEKRDGSADELTLSLQNADGKLAVPTAGRILSLCHACGIDQQGPFSRGRGGGRRSA
jgi:hypothetical protein